MKSSENRITPLPSMSLGFNHIEQLLTLATEALTNGRHHAALELFAEIEQLQQKDK